MAARPSGPPGHWLWGNLADYERDRLGFLESAYLTYGDVVAMDARTTLVNDPQTIVRLLRTPDAWITHDVLLRPITEARADEISRARALLNPGTRQSAIQDIGPLVAEELKSRLACLSNGQSTSLWLDDPVEFAEQVLSSAIGRMFLGADAPSIMARVRPLLDDLSRIIGNPLAAPPKWRTPLRRRIEARHVDLTQRLEAVLEQRRGCSAEDISSSVANHPRADQFTSQAKASMVAGALLASQRVPAASGAWLMHMLGSHRTIQTVLRESVRSAADHIPPRDSASEATAIALETLRLFPPTWLLQRSARRALEVAGRSYPQGHHFLMSPYTVQRSTRYFDNPLSFQPGRWSGDQASVGARDCFLAFGDGEHVCPGRHLAVRALASMALTLTSGYEVLETSDSVTADPRTTLLPKGSRIHLQRLH